MNVYNEIISGGFEGSRFTNSRSDVRGGSSRLNSNKQHKAYYTKLAFISPEAGGVFNSYDLPDKMNKLISVVHAVDAIQGTYSATLGLNSNAIRIPIERDVDKISLFANNENRGRYLGDSPTSTASADENQYNPNNLAFFVIGEKGFLSGTGQLPQKPPLNIMYLRYPGAVKESGLKVFNNPSLSVEQVNGTSPSSGFDNYVINDATSLNFDLPEAFLGDIVNEMAKLIGVQLEETMVYQYGSAEEVGNEKKQLN